MQLMDTVSARTRVKAGVGVLVVDAQGRLLLERRSDNGMWGLPGGRIEPGESIQEAACREVKEETGLTVRLTRLIGVYSDPATRLVVYQDNGDECHLVDIILAAEILAGDLTISSESLELRFFPQDSLPDEIFAPAQKPLEDFCQQRTGVIS